MAESYNAGVVTAYGAAVRGGYTGTYDEFCDMMANSANNAAEADAAADRAEAVLESIPSDYSTLSSDVTSLKAEINHHLTLGKNVIDLSEITKNKVVNSSGTLTTLNGVDTTGFCEVEASTTYISSGNNGVPTSFQVVGFYNSSKTFISRLTTSSTGKFTTPANTKYIRVSSQNGLNGFLPKTQIEKGESITPYEEHKTLSNTNTVFDDDIKMLKLLKYGLEKTASLFESALNIANDNTWYSGGGFTHICIPLEMFGTEPEIRVVGDRVRQSVYAFLTANSWTNGSTPSFSTSDQTRHLLAVNQEISMTAPSDANYLYLTYKDSSNNSYLPSILEIAGISLIGDVFPNADDNRYTTIFFDDFDGDLNTNIWSEYTQDVPSGWNYNSRFYASDKTIRTEQSCLVLSACKDNSVQKGTYIDHTGATENIEYISGYISSKNSFAFPKGKITARIKVSGGTTKRFPWCFWTFGQNGEWAYAEELDTIEFTTEYTDHDITSSTGVTIPAGSILEQVASNTHYHDSTQNKAIYNNHVLRYLDPSDESILYAEYNYSTSFDVTKWHEYSVEWDDSTIKYYIDNSLRRTVSASSVGAIDMSGNVGFKYPQDIRFNIKGTELSEDDNFSMFVDWVKVEVEDITPCLSITHTNASVSVGSSIYINPTFNDGCTNHAFTLETESNIIEIINSEENSDLTTHRIKGLSSGTASVKLKSANGITENTFTVTVT